MALGPTYQKYGGFSAPSNMHGMMSQQQSKGEGFNKVFDSVEALLKQTETIYKDNNTLNMQEYLKGKLQTEGLGAGPIDTVAIKRQFGNMINMDQLGQTFSEEKTRMEQDAVNKASTAANETLTNTGDAVQARSTLEQQLKELRAPQNLIDTARQSWTDANAIRLQDMNTVKEQEKEARVTSLFTELTDGKDSQMAIEMLVNALPAHEQDKERQRLNQEVELRSQLTEQQKEEQDYYLNLKNVEVQRVVQERQNRVAELEHAAVSLQQDGLKDSAYELASTFNSELGGSAQNQIVNRLDNWVEKMLPNSDGKHFTKLHQQLIERGIDDKDADAILIQAFNGSYGGDGLVFNSMNQNELINASATAFRLADNLKAKNAIGTQLSAARQAVSDAESKGQEKLIKLRQQLTQAGRNSRLRVAGSDNMETTYEKFLQTMNNTRTGSVTNPVTDPTAKPTPSVDDELKRLMAVGTPPPDDGDTDGGDDIVSPPIPQSTSGFQFDVEGNPVYDQDTGAFWRKLTTPSGKPEDLERLGRTPSKSATGSKNKDVAARRELVKKIIKLRQDGDHVAAAKLSKQLEDM